MDTRQQKILEVVIKEYVDTAEPVSSGVLVGRYSLKVSPATIRTEMKKLEEGGYLYQPHTSAGRVPTDKAYRFFIDSLMKSRELTLHEQEIIRQNFIKSQELDCLMQKAANFLADLSSNFAISSLIGFEEPEVFKAGVGKLLREPEFEDLEYLSQTTQILDYLDRNIDELFNIVRDETIGVYIGRENPIKQIRGLSMIISGQRLKSGNRGLIAILGPRRMHYDRNIALVEYIRNLLEGF